jgi:TonB-linked SusC/RagA family outer membrane protein
LVFALAAAGPLTAQSGTIAGTVVDPQSRPLAGARVTVTGTATETITNATGRFRLENLAGPSVSLRTVMIGYRPAVTTTAVGNQDVRIVLAPALVNLEEIVVTGTVGETRLRALGNSVAKVDASGVAETAPVSDVAQLLNARAPGVVLATQSGIAGGGAKILIRGPASMTFDGNPLIYVDGVRVNGDPSTGPAEGGAGAPTTLSRLNDINPNDIESIEVIKGPSAATLYGTEASNGVIQIITKKGRQGKARYDVRIRQGANWFVNPQGRLQLTYFQNPTTGTIDSLNLLAHEDSLGHPSPFRTGHLQGYGLDLSGGAETIRYFASVNFDRDEGVINVNTATRKTARLNLAVTPNPKFDVTTSVAATIGHTDSYTADYTSALYYNIPQTLNTPSRGYLGTPPDVIAATESLTQDLDRYTVSVTANHRPTGWFSHRFTAGIDLTDTQNAIVVPRVPAQYSVFFSPTDALGFRTANRTNTRFTTADYAATARFSLSKALGSATSVGGQYYSRVDELTGVTGAQFAGAGVRTVSGATIRTGTDNVIQNTTVGLYVQQQFDWRNRLFLTGALRGDANSAFGSEFKAVKYPKVSASWVVSEEPFWKVPFVTQLKLRAAYGQSGQQPAAFAAVRTYAPVPGTGDAAAGTPQSPGNPNLGPERGKEIELGFDANLFADRAGVSFTWYNRKTTNAILLREVAPSSGFDGRQYVNAGELRNRGLELLVTGRPVQTRNLSWDLSLNLSTNDNKVVDLGIPGLAFLPVGFLPNRLQNGYPVGSYWSKRIVSADLGADGIATNLMCDSGTGGAPLPCDTAPQVFLGQPFAKVDGAVTSTISLGQHFRFYAMADFKRGAKLLNTSPLLLCAFLGDAEINLHPERFPATQVAECQQGLNALGTSLIQDASYVKLREVSVTYDPPARWARFLGAAAAQVTLGVRNIHTWTNFKGLDPETSTVSSWLASEHTEAVLPLPLQVLTTIRLSF